MNIFESLREEHDIQRDLLDKIVKTSGDTKTRYGLWKRLKNELEIHADGEERYFYTPLMQVDISQQKARHSVAEHHEIDELIEKIEETDLSSPAWLTYAKQLKEMVEHHLDEEEQEIFQVGGKALNEEQKKSLAEEYRGYISNAREERPHSLD